MKTCNEEQEGRSCNKQERVQCKGGALTKKSGNENEDLQHCNSVTERKSCTGENNTCNAKEELQPEGRGCNAKQGL